MEAVLRPVADPRWASFVNHHPAALPFHHPAWAQMMAACYGFRTFAVTVTDGTGEIVGGVPVIEVRRPRQPPRWVSLPFTDHVPPLSLDGGDPAFARCLDGARQDFAVGRFEIRGELAGAEPDGAFLTHRLALDRPERDILAGAHPNQVRRNIRRAEQAGVTVRHGTTEADLADAYYRLHTRTRRRLGVPVQPRRYFRALWRYVVEPGRGTVLLAELAGTPVAGAVFLLSPGTCVYKYGASDERSWPARPNHALFWQAIRWAAEQGCHTFDFGRTDLGHESLREFKARWGAAESVLRYSVLLDRSAPESRRPRGLPPGVRAVIRRGPGFVPRLLGELTYRRYA